MWVAHLTPGIDPHLACACTVAVSAKPAVCPGLVGCSGGVDNGYSTATALSSATVGTREILITHGTADATIPYTGGPSSIGVDFNSVQVWLG